MPGEAWALPLEETPSAVTDAAASAPFDEAAFAAFHAATWRPLWAYLYRASGDAAVADDLAQEAYLRLLQASGVPADPTARRPYLFRTATNLLRDRFRRRSRWQGLLERWWRPQGATLPRSALGSDLDAVFARLSTRERQLLWLAHVEELSHREVAAALGVKEASVRPMVFRARQRLAGLLREAGLAPEEDR